MGISISSASLTGGSTSLSLHFLCGMSEACQVPGPHTNLNDIMEKKPLYDDEFKYYSHIDPNFDE